MTKNYDAVLFDFDGTIADTGRGVFNSIKYAIDAMGFEPISEQSLRTFIGPPIYDSFKRELGMTPEQCDAAVKKYREKYSESGIYQLEMYDGIEALMRELKHSNIKVGIASSKPENFVFHLLDFLKINELVDFVSCPESDDSPQDKTSLINNAVAALNADKKRVLMVGDRLFDIGGANGAGVESVGVTFGYGSREELEKAGATYIAENSNEIKEVIFS